MKVLLTQDVARVGKRGDVHDVKDGFARNYLLRLGLARAADNASVAVVKQKADAEDQKQRVKSATLREYQATLPKVHIVLKKKANDKGQLFAGIHAGDIAEKLNAQGFKLIKENMVRCSLLKKVGEYCVDIDIDGAVVPMRVIIQAL